MRLLIQSAIIFFGTLFAAGLLALGEPRAWPALQAPSAAGVLLLQGSATASAAAQPRH